MPERLSNVKDFAVKTISKATGIETYRRLKGDFPSHPNFDRARGIYGVVHHIALPLSTEALTTGNLDLNLTNLIGLFTEAGVSIGTIALLTSGKPELAVGIKAAYNTGAAVMPDAIRLAAAKTNNFRRNVTPAF